MMGMSSTLVETVSINYEDFNESFLTCGTCLLELSRRGMYDGGEHTPKLLSCSHTVCLHCLSRIAASQTRDTGTFRCPICRELITIPRGGVSALPPSFLVNQLLDLMSRQRRDVIPKCSVHINQELLFCETCDTVFCNLCTATTGHQSSSNSPVSGEHTIIPFSIAIKRMSEILLYKANECISKLSAAQESVRTELHRLESAKDRTIEQVNQTINEVAAMLETRRQELLAAVAACVLDKRKVLDEQLAIIDAEKSKVERECEGLQYQVEVRNITQKVAHLAEKLDSACSLSEPRENSFLTCDFTHNDAIQLLPQQFKRLGRVRTSTTFPNLCKYEVEDRTLVANLSSSVLLHTVDYRGNPRNTGGDPVAANLVKENDSSVSVPVSVQDLENGSYRLTFRPQFEGRYNLNIRIFDRLIRDCPILLDVTEHNNPIKSFGIKGSGKDGFLQPVAVTVDPETNLIYVVDTGNSRIKVLNAELEFIRHIENEGLEGRSCTGIDICKQGLAVVNWRTKTVTSMDFNGTTLSKFVYNGFQEPTDLCIDREYGHILVADNGLCSVLVFDSSGKFLFQVGKKGCFSLISSLCIGPGNSIFVADAKLHVFSPKGDVLDGIPESKGRGRFGGVAVDKSGRMVVARTEKNKNILQVYQLPQGELISTIDSNEVKLKRPGGLSLLANNHVIVVDLGNDCIRKYRYY